jgi:hypothetical protein
MLSTGHLHRCLIVVALSSFMSAQIQKESKPGQSKSTQSQPIPFSHRVHVSSGSKCLDCHKRPQQGDTDMGLPAESICMYCHITVKAESPAVIKVVQYYWSKKPIPWLRIYRLPDYVYFSHSAHVNRGKIECDICHGPVGEREVLVKEKDISMAACMECHATRGASVRCNYCHNANP